MDIRMQQMFKLKIVLRVTNDFRKCSEQQHFEDNYVQWLYSTTKFKIMVLFQNCLTLQVQKILHPFSSTSSNLEINFKVVGYYILVSGIAQSV